MPNGVFYIFINVYLGLGCTLSRTGNMALILHTHTHRVSPLVQAEVSLLFGFVISSSLCFLNHPSASTFLKSYIILIYLWLFGWGELLWRIPAKSRQWSYSDMWFLLSFCSTNKAADFCRFPCSPGNPE